MNTYPVELQLPVRPLKPRQVGLTILIDNGVPIQQFKDTISSFAEMIDFVKFGWCTSLITKQIEEKMECLKLYNVSYFFGGTMFEKFLSQDKIDEFYRYCKHHKCTHIEVSNGTLDLTNSEKARYIKDFSAEFKVFSEVGRKNSDQADSCSSYEWIASIQEDLAAGATKVITEAREGGSSGICTKNGTLRYDLLEDILSSGTDENSLIFEAPTKLMQTYFIKKVGPQVNLANIPFTEIIPLETLRLGLRSDTFHLHNEEAFS
ncbi:phosphosulfolactate synthase [Halalkalibacterium ligniniphilum]|uniref:phosphosulfolactate synthase n=1 Tax=Halalkalibacterium ligniniphilum TaxID=1134413 RepID=UPI00034AF415|nr:phosphosulfolactate synthase [Halalkalibacterium ligniniphilum]